MGATLEICFPFSACFDDADGGLAAHNYTLRLLTEPLPRPDEKRLRERVEKELIGRVASRDLGRDVDFLRGKKLTESLVLSEFRAAVETLIAPRPMLRLALERGDGTCLSWAPDAR